MTTQSLGGMILSSAYDQVDKYLRTSGDDLSQELTARDENGMTPLHIAVKQGDFEMVKLLLSFDAPINAKIGTKNVKDFAKELVTSGEVPRRRIYALIKSRGQWQSAAAREQGVLFSRSMKVIEDAKTKIEGAAGKTGVLFLGITGEGKSTLINCLFGVDYEKTTSESGVSQVVAKGKETAPVGNSPTSETFLPQVVELKDRSYVLIDLPGFEDTRGTAEEICAAASICMLTKQLLAIQSILLVCSWDTIKDARMVNYRKAAYNIGAMINANPLTAENVVLVVTKPQKRTEAKHVKNRLMELKTAEKWDSQTRTDPKDMDNDMWKKHCLRHVTETFLSREGSIMLADVTKPNVREEFQRNMKALEEKSKTPTQFDFKNYSRFMHQFKLVMEGMIVNFNELVRKQKLQDDKIKNFNTSINELEQEKTALEKAIKEYEQQRSEPFTEESFNQKILEEKNKLIDLRKRVLAQSKALQEAELAQSISAAKRSSVVNEGERLIDTVHRGWVCIMDPKN